MSSDLDIFVGDISDAEAHVYVRYRGAMTGVVLRGTLRGPYCENVRTLPAEFLLRNSLYKGQAQAEVVVPDPCMWSADMPHMYQIDVEAVHGEQVIAEYHGPVGFRRLSPRLPVDFAPGTG